MGRITNLQHQVGQLQQKLAAQATAIHQVAARDKKIKDAIKAHLAKDPAEDGNKLLSDIAVLI